MKFSTLLILACGGVALFALLHVDKGEGRSTGSTGPITVGARAPTSSSWPFTVKPPVASSSSSPDSLTSGVLSSALAFLGRGLSAATSRRTTWQRSELRIARGTVVDQFNTGLVLDCSGWVVKSATHPGVYAGDGRGMNSLYANLVDAHERLQYGSLMAVDHGTVRQSVYDPAMWTSESYLSGRLFLKDYPLGSPSRGKGFKVVAVPDGSTIWQGNSIPAYTASFTLSN